MFRVTFRDRRSAWWSRCVVAAAVTLSAAAFSSAAQAGYDQFSCNSSNASWCFSLYEHHSKMVQAWYEGSGSLPLAVGSLKAPAGGAWLFYADSGTSGRGYNAVSACAYSSCAVNSSQLGRMSWQNRHASVHTVLARDTY